MEEDGIIITVHPKTTQMHHLRTEKVSIMIKYHLLFQYISFTFMLF